MREGERAVKDFDPETIGTLLVSLLYYLYRQAGCPFGDTLTGLDAWIKLSIEAPFEQLSDKEEA